MTIFRLNFLLKVGQMKVCQNPSFISTHVCSGNCKELPTSLYPYKQKHAGRCLLNVSS